jgi:large conductance mechanosensitive channel
LYRPYYLIGGINFTDIKIQLKAPVLNLATGRPTQEVTINIGNFIQSLVDFGIIAFVVFLLVKGINRMQRKEAEVPVLTKDQELLIEIRDLLKKK